MTGQPPITRSGVRALLAHYRLGDGDRVSDDTVTAWLRDLRGYSAGECHAALASLPGHQVRTVTPAEIVRLVDAARTRPAFTVVPGSARPALSRDRQADRARHAAAGERGIHAIYAEMGWARNPDHDLARSVPCEFCRARRGQVCGPLSRNRFGHREQRDPITRMHPSRLAAARAAQSNPSSNAVEASR